MMAEVTQLDVLSTGTDSLSDDASDLTQKFRDSANELIEILNHYTPRAAKLKDVMEGLSDIALPDFFASIIKTSPQEKLSVLNEPDTIKRYRLVQPLLARQIETLRLVGGKFQKNSNFISDVLRRQADGSGGGIIEGDEEDELVELEKKIKTSNLPEHALKAADKELKRLKSLPTHFPEHSVSRNYLDILLDLPWTNSTVDTLDIGKAKLELDKDHYGLIKVKKRIIEHLAVMQLKNSLRGPILCLVGAPGVGKTSIGRSIANIMGRKFHRLSVGGVCDQSDIRGHRRTYVGSMPGRIIEGLRTAGVNNPVMLLDEIDKLSKGIHGDPSAALLEVLDPEQNNSFTDHYLGIPFDLSNVLFIATANSTSPIPSPLLDRMEVIHLSGYTIEEKAEIARQHLMSKVLKQHGLGCDDLEVPVDVIKSIALQYTREAGVRELERQLSAICRVIAVDKAEKKLKGCVVVDDQLVQDILGPVKYYNEISERLTQPGVAIGLAWLPSGGKILFVEATQMKGSGQLILTGQLGSVMQESAKIALNWLRANSSLYQLNMEDLNQTDIHVHFPAGAVEKDGPSAGVTIATVLASLFSKTCVRSDIAMTGEITLRGTVLPVGGVKDKLLAAHRAGITNIILPKRNEKDMLDIPSDTRAAINVILVQNIHQVLEVALTNLVRKPLASKL
jgi:ATP-dependent Lon protease